MSESLIDLYISGKSENTARTYRAVIRQWSEYLEGKNETLTTATAESAIGYFTHLRKKGAADATITARIDALSSIYCFLEDMEAIKKNPIRRAKRALRSRQKHQVRPTAFIEFKEVRKMLNTIKPNTPENIRNLALLSILFGGGLRRSEAAGLNLNDVLTTPEGIPFLRIRKAKGGEGRDVALPAWAWENFSMLVSQRKSEGGSGGDPLFVNYTENYTGRRISTYTLYRIYKSYTGAAPHSARATFATALLKQGANDRDVGLALGHKSDKMVKVYDKRSNAPGDSVAINLKY